MHLKNSVKTELLRSISGALLSIVVPAAYFLSQSTRYLGEVTFTSSMILTAIAVLLGCQFQRRLFRFPDVTIGPRVVTSFTMSYGLVLAFASLTRSDYSTVFLSVSYLTCIAFFLIVEFWNFRRSSSAMAILNIGKIPDFLSVPKVRSTFIETIDDYRTDMGPLVIDLRYDHDDYTLERIAALVLEGVIVLHTKRAFERLAGRVSIEHLSENEFGSLLPEQPYLRVKPVIDFVLAVCMTPVFAIVLAPLILLMLVKQGRPIFYRQERRGLKGRPFMLYKLRTMEVVETDDERSGELDVDALLTRPNDPRITPFGRFLRARRFDELPQIWNVLAGDMSWVGPRPEAAALSYKYQRLIPFYAYRHVLKPGLTGWAQINSGHVTEMEATTVKLEYDFYYVKMVSLWLDFLVLLRTAKIVIAGMERR